MIMRGAHTLLKSMNVDEWKWVWLLQIYYNRGVVSSWGVGGSIFNIQCGDPNISDYCS